MIKKLLNRLIIKQNEHKDYIAKNEPIIETDHSFLFYKNSENPYFLLRMRKNYIRFKARIKFHSRDIYLTIRVNSSGNNIYNGSGIVLYSSNFGRGGLETFRDNIELECKDFCCRVGEYYNIEFFFNGDKTTILILDKNNKFLESISMDCLRDNREYLLIGAGGTNKDEGILEICKEGLYNKNGWIIEGVFKNGR